ncbi:MAG: hypothetical protein IKP60_04695 [Treponema sp.]|nr:hypothetical protein [Treponema sp.]
MKKRCLILFYIVCSFGLFAQTVPNGRQFFGAVHQFTEDWSGTIDSADISATGTSAETYVLKNVTWGWSQWEGLLILGDYHYYQDVYSVTITKDENGRFKIDVENSFKRAEFNKDFSKQLSDWEIRDKLGENAKELVSDLSKKLTFYLGESDSQYEKYINSALTDFQFLHLLSKTKNALWMKTFTKRNNIIGRTAKTDVKVVSLDESDDENFLYRLEGKVGTTNKATGAVAIDIVFYSNDDALLDANVGKSVTIVGDVEEIVNGKDGSVSAVKLVGDDF